MEAGEVKELPIILKADVGGSAEVLTETLQKLSNDKVKIRVLHSGVGAINESDVLLASASNAIIIGFNVRPERNAAALAEQEKVDIRLHTIIYNLTDEIKTAMTGLLAPVFKEVYKGKAEVRETFRITKVGNVAGCMVQDGTITRDSEVRLLRDNVVVYTGKIGSLRRFKDDVSEVKSGMECGITLENYRRRQAGRHHRSVRHRAGGHRSIRLRRTMAAIGVLTLELRLREFAFAEGQAPRGEEPEGPAAQQVQRGGGRDRLSGPVAAGRGGGGHRLLRPRPRRKGAAVGGRRGRRAAGPRTGRRVSGVDMRLAGEPAGYSPAIRRFHGSNVGTSRVSEAVREELSELIGFETARPAPAAVDVTDVHVSPDGRHATRQSGPARRRAGQQEALAALEHAPELSAARTGQPPEPPACPGTAFRARTTNPDVGDRIDILLKRAKKTRGRTENQP